MSLESMLSQSGVIRRPTVTGGTDALGRPVVAAGAAVSVACRIGRLEQRQMEPDVDGRVSTVAVLFLPLGVDVLPTDALTVDGAVWEIIGPVDSRSTPGGTGYQSAPVRKVAAA